MQMPKHLT